MEIFHWTGGTGLLIGIIVDVPKVEGGSLLGTRQWSQAGRENEILHDITYVWNLKFKKKNETNREQIGDCQRQVRGCGSSGWNGRMSEKKESKKNIDSIS